MTEAELRNGFTDYAVVLIHGPKDLISFYRLRAAERAADARMAMATADNAASADPEMVLAYQPIVFRPVKKART